MNATARLSDLALSESGFVFDPYSGGTFTVNRAGMVILHALRDGLARSGIIERLHAEFQAGGADLESDVGEFVRLLVQQGLLPADFSLDTLTEPTTPAATAESRPAVHVSPPASCLGPAAAMAAEVTSGITPGAGAGAGTSANASASAREGASR